MSEIIDIAQVENDEREKVVGILSQLDFFKKFSNYEKKRIASQHAHFFSFKNGDNIIEEGTRDTAFFILVSGQVSVVKQGIDSPLVRLAQGQFFGEMAFLTGMIRTSGVVADSEVVVIRVDQKLMSSLGIEIREKIKDQLIDKLVQDLAATTRQLQNVSKPA